MSSSQNSMTPEKALERLQRLCAQREKCTYDLIQKLTQWGVGQNDINKIITSLKHDGFVDDQRFARLYVREKSKFNKWGPIKIRTMLSAKKISKEIIDAALSELSDEKTSENLFDLLKKKKVQIKAKNSYDLRNKLIRFGVSRGFPLDDVFEAVNRLINSGD
ncbi:MAG: regulatory protein [Tenuifilum sp.]|uniref:regulatory protein RecX n=1 Tax=Tenuifilum sp. TaxID=2760880 RepID=UPI0024AC24EF|nr:regulatory protein RecX [Tenuifilum sp.]MDI3527682.1 regulatory protein [Tenuifilum sp.]